MASILKYYQPVSSKLPDPNGPLSKKVTSRVIELANARVSELKDKLCAGRTRPLYLILTPAQRFEVGK